MREPTRRSVPLSARLTAVLLALLCAAGCARPVPVDDAPLPADSAEVRPPEGTPEAILEVENLSNYDVRVFVIVGGQARRLGFVTSRRTTQFGLPHLFVGRDVRFRAVPVSYSRTQTTDAVVIRPGQVVRFGLEKELRSHTLVYY